MQWTKLTNFELPRLEYAVTTTYPWRHFTLVAIAISTIVLVFLTFVNVQAVGYESFSAADDYRPPGQRHWWSAFIRQSLPDCDPHQILQGDTFKTNISIFNYIVDYINTPVSQVDPYSRTNLSGLAYAADPLATACDEQPGDHRTLKLKVDNVQQTVTGSVEFNCSFATSIMAVTASHTVSYSVTDDTLFGPPLLETPGIKRVIQVLALDLAQSVGPRSWLSAAAFIRCNQGDQDLVAPAVLEECHNNPAQLEVTGAEYAYANTTRESARLTDPSITNYFQALSAASLADTGIWHNNSIFVSLDIVNATLQHGYNADFLRKDPSSFIVTPTPAIILMTYNCHFQRRKSALNFIISVLVADVSLFAPFWAIFSFIASSLARPKTFPDHDVEAGNRMSARDYTSEAVPMIHRNSTSEYIGMQTAIPAAA